MSSCWCECGSVRLSAIRAKVVKTNRIQVRCFRAGGPRALCEGVKVLELAVLAQMSEWHQPAQLLELLE
eukprot:801115-Pleurochrysis_carterae.AAC.2